MENRVRDTLIMSFDSSHGTDRALLVLGRREDPKSSGIKIVNAFQGQEAIDLYHKLTTVLTSKPN